MVNTQWMIVIITIISDFSLFLLLKVRKLTSPVTDDHLKCNLSVNKYCKLNYLWLQSISTISSKSKIQIPPISPNIQSSLSFSEQCDWVPTSFPQIFVLADLYHLIFYKLPPSSLLSSIHLGSHVIHSDFVLASLYFLWWRLCFFFFFFLTTLFSVHHTTCNRADALQSSVKCMNEWRMKPT